MKSNRKYFQKKVDAYNLQEMLVVLVIIGILILAAMVAFDPIVSRAKSIEAQNHLKTVYSLQKTYFFMHSKYSNELNEIDFVLPKTVKNGGNANYTYEIVEASHNSFKAKAIAVVDFDGDGIFNVWEIDNEQKLKEVIKD